MTTRYVAVPVEIVMGGGFTDVNERFGKGFSAQLLCQCCYYVGERIIGFGLTEDEAFADLLKQLGYDEAK